MIKTTEENEKVISMFLAGTDVIFEDGTLLCVDALVEFRNQDKGLAAISTFAEHQCLNKVIPYDFLGMKKLCSTDLSIGGTLIGELNLSSIREYNDTVVMDGGKISRVILRNGTEILVK